MSGTWVQSICDRCFELFNPGRQATRVIDAEEEICGICGEKHCSGIYIRADPALTPYPRKPREEKP